MLLRIKGHTCIIQLSLRCCLDPTCLLGTLPHTELFETCSVCRMQKKRSVKISTVSVSVYVTIQNSAFCGLALQKGRASTKNNSDQRKKNPKQKMHPFLWASLSHCLGVTVYLMSFLDCESTPPLSGFYPRFSYGMTGSKSGFKIYFYSLSLSVLISSSLLREKYGGLSFLTTTAKTQRETLQFGKSKSLCRGGTGADGVAGWRGLGARQPVP